MKMEKMLHWADEKEVVSNNRPIKLLVRLLSYLPEYAVRCIVYPVSFFYFVFSERAREETYLYQKQLKEYTNGRVPKRISSFMQILSFSFCLVEKIETWRGKVNFDEIVFHDDDVLELEEYLESGRGAVLIGSHLGNIELLRGLANFNCTGVARQVPVTAIMELNNTEQFNKTMQEVNSKFLFNVIAPSSIGPDTICILTEQIQNGGLVVIAGDRTSARVRTRFIKEKFLGKDAAFPYGAFLMTALINAPTYFLFGLRTKTSTLFPKYNMFVERSKINFDCPRSERENRIKALCHEFVEKLEKYCELFPYQWYNFYNFWLMPEAEKHGR